MAYDGIQNNNRVDVNTQRKLDAKVVDNILNSRTYASRLFGMGEPFYGKTMDYAIKITDSASGEFFTGLETLNSAASDTEINLSFAHTAFQQPIVSIMTESFANAGPEGIINSEVFKREEAFAEAVQRLGTAIYSTGSANQPLGLGAIVDDGTTVATIGGQSRSTYTSLKATKTAASSGILSLTVLATLEDAVSAAGLTSEEPNINVTTKTGWSLYEQLLQPSVRADYASVGYNAIALRGNDLLKSASELKGHAGLTAVSFRAKPVTKDDACTSGYWYMNNERYFGWKGRTIVPDEYAKVLTKVDFGNMGKALAGTGGAEGYLPPKATGWFSQGWQMLPNQAGMISRLYCIGQVCVKQPRRSGVETGITTV